MRVDDKRAARAAGTRSQLIAAGRLLFAEQGFAATSTEDIVGRSGVTRGALYYHFRSKQELFTAVLAEVQEEVHLQVTAAGMAGAEAWPGLKAGCAAYLDASLDPAVQRIALLDGPAVLGWEEWQRIVTPELFGLLATGLHYAMAEGAVPDQPVAPLAHVLLGALNAGAMFVARATDREAARAEVRSVLDQVLEGLRTPPEEA